MRNAAQQALEIFTRGETREQTRAREHIAVLIEALQWTLEDLSGRLGGPGEEEVVRAVRSHRPIGWHPEIGAPVTVCIGSDSYADVITAVSQTGRSFATAKHGYFRLDKYAGWRRSNYNAMIGFAETELDPSF